MALQPQHGRGVDSTQALRHAAGLPHQLQQAVGDPVVPALWERQLLGQLLHLVLHSSRVRIQHLGAWVGALVQYGVEMGATSTAITREL